jgi:Ca2+-binding EF-hand superfamily protein
MGGKLATRKTYQPKRPYIDIDIDPPIRPDFQYLCAKTGLLEQEIKSIFGSFKAISGSEGKLNRADFSKLYSSLRHEPFENIEKISEFVFKAFDLDKNGSISFDEFLIGYKLTSRSDLKQRLEFTFGLYDINGNGYLDKDEISILIDSMLSLLGLSQQQQTHLAQECLVILDSNGDGKISKGTHVH